MNYLVAGDSWFADAPGGAARVAGDIAAVMRDRGHRVAALAMRPQAGLPDVEDLDGIRVVRYDKPQIASFRPDAAGRCIAAAATAARRHLADIRWDVVHFHTPYTGNGALAAFGAGPRYVLTVHSPVVLEQRINWAGEGWKGWLKLALGLPLMRRLESRLVRAAERIHTLSEFTRRQVERFHAAAAKTTVIPHWRRPELRRTLSQTEARKQLGWPAGEPIVFTVRALVERNGLADALQALTPVMRERGCMLYIGGRGALRPRLERMAAEAGINERTVFMGRISDEHLALAYQAADLFLLPTRALECFGLIIIEALSYGCPVIATDAGAIPEVLAPLGRQFIVPAGDVAAMRARVEDFLAGRLQAPPADRLVDYVAQRYDADVVVPRMVELLEGRSAVGRRAAG